jgi:PKD repeat protein
MTGDKVMNRNLYLLLGAMLASLLFVPAAMGTSVTVQAESYSSYGGGPAETEYFASVSSSALCNIRANEWTQYTVTSPGAGTVPLTAYIAANDARTVKIYVNGVLQRTLSVSDTNSWTNFVARSTTVTLRAGANTIRFLYSGPMNFDRFRVDLPSTAPLVASFTWRVVPGTYTVQFTDTSTGNPTSWDWEFTHMALPNPYSHVRNPSFTYPGPGTYRVQMMVHRGALGDSETKDIVVPPITSTARTYQAESYSSYGGGPAETQYFPSVSSSALCYIRSGEWTQYSGITKSTAGSYPIRLYIAANDARTVKIYVNGALQRTLSVSDTNSWTNFVARSSTVTLRAGANTIKFVYSGPMNFDRFTV